MPPAAQRPRGPKLKFTPEDDQLLIDLKEKKNLTWKQIADFFPGRSSGTLQVRYCTKLKAKPMVWTDDMVSGVFFSSSSSSSSPPPPPPPLKPQCPRHAPAAASQPEHWIRLLDQLVSLRSSSFAPPCKSTKTTVGASFRPKSARASRLSRAGTRRANSRHLSEQPRKKSKNHIIIHPTTLRQVTSDDPTSHCDVPNGHFNILRGWWASRMVRGVSTDASPLGMVLVSQQIATRSLSCYTSLRAVPKALLLRHTPTSVNSVTALSVIHPVDQRAELWRALPKLSNHR